MAKPKTFFQYVAMTIPDFKNRLSRAMAMDEKQFSLHYSDFRSRPDRIKRPRVQDAFCDGVNRLMRSHYTIDDLFLINTRDQMREKFAFLVEHLHEQSRARLFGIGETHLDHNT